MKSSLEAVDLVYKLIAESSLKTAISGDVYKLKRPLNSDKEDVVINSLPVTNSKIQRGLINVNIHVPNLELDGDPIDKTLPNTARLKTLSAQALDLLKENWGTVENYLLEVDNQTVFPDGSNHFSNIRISFYHIQN